MSVALHWTPVVPPLSCTVEPRIGNYSGGELKAPEERAKFTSCNLLAKLFLMWCRIPLVLFATRAHCLLMFNLVSARIPSTFSVKLFSRQLAPSTYRCMELFLPRCRTLHLPLWNLYIYTAAQPSGLSAPPQYIYRERLYRYLQQLTLDI